MIDSSAGIELFGSASPDIIGGLQPAEVAGAFSTYLGMFYRGVRYPDALSGLLREVEEGSKGNPALTFVKQYQPLFLELEAYLRTNKESTVAKATLNQRLAQGLSAALTEFEIGENAMKFIEIVAAMRTANIELGKACSKALNGARAQCGLMGEFERHEYKILIPDTDDTEEVSLWDVRGGTDFVAVKMQGTKVMAVVLVDAKSDAGSFGSSSNNYRIETHSNADRRIELWNEIAASALSRLAHEIPGLEVSDNLALRHMNIILHGRTMDELGKIKDYTIGNWLMQAVEKNFPPII